MSSSSASSRSVSATASQNSPHHSGSTSLVLFAFIVVYLVWGGTYLAIRIGVESFPPLIMSGTRHFLVGLLVFPLCWKSGFRPTAAHWRTAAITGVCLQFMGNGGVSMAETKVPSGVAALLVAMVSLWLVLLDWLRPGGRKPVPRVIAGLLLGLAGIFLLVGPRSFGGTGRINSVGVAILAIATFAWAIGSLYSKHGALPESALLGVAMQSLCGSAALWITGAFLGELHGFHFANVTARSWWGLAYLVIFGSLFGFTAYIYILKKSTATRVATYAFVNPVVALFLGWLIVGEAITLRTALAAVVILTAVILVITAPHPAPSHSDEIVPVAGEA